MQRIALILNNFIPPHCDKLDRYYFRITGKCTHVSALTD